MDSIDSRERAALTSESLVSVIMAAYNAAPYIKEALDSVLAQTYTRYEIIVVNDGSPDTAELEKALEPYRNRIVYLKQENRGVSAARNAGLRMAQGEFVSMLDPDDRWEPEYLEAQLAVMIENQGLTALYPDAVVFGDVPEAGKTLMEKQPSTGEVTFEALLTRRCTVANYVIARREAVLQAGGFDECLRRSEDFDLWLRMLLNGGRFAYQRRVLAHYRVHRGSLSSDQVQLTSDTLRVFDKLALMPSLTHEERNLVKNERQHYQALLRFKEGKRAFHNGDIHNAEECLREANEFFKSRKTSLVLLLLRVAPRLLVRAYDLRDRFVFRASTRI
jgi:glycosyltransferase involved in cell wall biosynthesis